MNTRREEAATQSLLDTFEPKTFPTKIDLWRLVVQVPEPPEYTQGGIAIPDEYRDRKEFHSYIGYVLQIGPLAFKAVTRSGLDYRQAHGVKVGDWVHFGKHAGEKFRTRDGTLFIVLTDSEVIGVCDNPEEFECMLM
jgi:co-chaperonin GroES (HSP10)